MHANPLREKAPESWGEEALSCEYEKNWYSNPTTREGQDVKVNCFYVKPQKVLYAW
jgi:hypothetical protein